MTSLAIDQSIEQWVVGALWRYASGVGMQEREAEGMENRKPVWLVSQSELQVVIKWDEIRGAGVKEKQEIDVPVPALQLVGRTAEAT